MNRKDSDMGEGAEALCRRRATVVQTRRLGGLTWLVLSTPGFPAAEPGQFVMLQSERSRCFLGRPFSIADQTAENVAFLIAPVGEASRELCGCRKGDGVWLLGPLGNGFALHTVIADARRVVLVGGGVGVAPFPLLLRRLGEIQRGRSFEVLVLLGFRDKAQSQAARVVRAALNNAKQDGVTGQLLVVREDDPRSPGTVVSDLVRDHIEAGDRLLVCGPLGMSRAVWEICRDLPGVKAWFSLETVMACGVGACHGCVIAMADGSLCEVCSQGPVFRGEEVFGA